MEKWLYRASIALVVIGLVVSVYMTIYKFSGNDGMCLGSGQCAEVNASIFSEVNGVPVAVVGIIGYAAILAVHLLEKRNAFLRENATLFIFGMSLTGFIFTVWLVYVEIAIIKALCPFCVTSQVAMTLIFIIAIVRLIKQPQS
jgi:uncharacterized membrane protein